MRASLKKIGPVGFLLFLIAAYFLYEDLAYLPDDRLIKSTFWNSIAGIVSAAAFGTFATLRLNTNERADRTAVSKQLRGPYRWRILVNLLLFMLWTFAFIDVLLPSELQPVRNTYWRLVIFGVAFLGSCVQFGTSEKA